MLEPVEKTIRKQEGGTHADEIETSIMLYIDPASVDMKKAVKDYHGDSPRGGLTRDPKKEGVILQPASGVTQRWLREGKGRLLQRLWSPGFSKK